MTGVAVDIWRDKRDTQHKLGLDKATRDALADYCRRRWATGTAKLAACEWDLSADEGRGVVAGRASQTTIDKIIKHRRGGWAVLMPVLAEVIGHGIEHFLQEQRKSHEDQAARLAALAGGHLHLAADRGDRDPGAGGSLDRRSRSFGHRASRHAGE